MGFEKSSDMVTPSIHIYARQIQRDIILWRWLCCCVPALHSVIYISREVRHELLSYPHLSFMWEFMKSPERDIHERTHSSSGNELCQLLSLCHYYNIFQESRLKCFVAPLLLKSNVTRMNTYLKKKQFCMMLEQDQFSLIWFTFQLFRL